MIPYQRSAFGINLLFRINGSATYRSIAPGLIGVAFFSLYRELFDSDTRTETEIDHPYAVGVIVSGITFLIIFRASQGYSRYWEATTSCYTMMSKWMDATVHTASYHMQSENYNNIKPPSFYDYHYLDKHFLTRDRERIRESDRGTHHGIMNRKRMVTRSINQVDKPRKDATKTSNPSRRQPSRRFVSADSANERSSEVSCDTSSPGFLTGKSRLDGNWGSRFTATSQEPAAATFYDPKTQSIPKDARGFASNAGGHTAPLFLQELAHLSSLLVAVAFATLRNDIDGAESPLDYYEAGQPWPKVDPGDIPEINRSVWYRMWAAFLYFLGRGRTPEERTRYNAMRPLPVIGGVSNAEIRFLQLARGPYAKTQLCWHWLSEFITREHLAGSLGRVGPPIISRIVQFLGDGMAFYNHGRKIMSIPFPFVHAQLSAVFVMVMIVLIPFLMDNYCPDYWTGAILTFLSVMCLSGIHEVARELENPFRNVPNELPVVTLMAEYNEALLIMYAGYHPDFFWEPPVQPVPPNGEGQSNSDKPNSAAPIESLVEMSRLRDVHVTSDECSSGVSGQNNTESSIRNDGRATTGSAISTPTTEPIGMTPDTSTPVSEVNGVSSAEKDDSELNELRAVVLQQGRIMSQMLEEQARLNKLVEDAILRRKKIS